MTFKILKSVRKMTIIVLWIALVLGHYSQCVFVRKAPVLWEIYSRKHKMLDVSFQSSLDGNQVLRQKISLLSFPITETLQFLISGFSFGFWFGIYKETSYSTYFSVCHSLLLVQNSYWKTYRISLLKLKNYILFRPQTPRKCWKWQGFSYILLILPQGNLVDTLYHLTPSPPKL